MAKPKSRNQDQIDASRSNLELGRKRQPILSADERFAVQWPLGHVFPGYVDGPKDDAEAWSRWFLLGRDNASEFPLTMDQDKRGWCREMRAKLESILVHRVFQGRPSLGLDVLLKRLGSKPDSRPERRRRACEAILNFDLIVESVIETDFPELPAQQKLWLDRIKRWKQGDPMGAYFTSRFHFLMEENAQVTLEEAGVFTPIFVAWENYFCGRANSGSKGGVKKRKLT